MLMCLKDLHKLDSYSMNKRDSRLGATKISRYKQIESKGFTQFGQYHACQSPGNPTVQGIQQGQNGLVGLASAAAKMVAAVLFRPEMSFSCAAHCTRAAWGGERGRAYKQAGCDNFFGKHLS